MKVILQKVSYARVSTKQLYNEIDRGYVLFVGINNDSTEKDAEKLAEKIANARVFEDSEGKINLSIKETGGDILSISQFTLYADVKKGNRPSFTRAAGKECALPLYKTFNEHLETHGMTVKEGFFGEHMDVTIHNDGPITMIYESRDGKII